MNTCPREQNDEDTGNCREVFEETDMTVPPPPEYQEHDNQNPNIRPMEKYVQTTKVRKAARRAEILWAVHCVMNHHSFKSNVEISQLFETMFFDSNIAKMYSCSADKMAYLTSFGFAEALKEGLIKSVSEESHFAISFDEAFNKVLQVDQMDGLVRFWQADRVVTRYLNTAFLDKTTAADLLQALKQITTNLKYTAMVQLGMDGPKVNLKLLKLAQEDRKQQDADMPDLLETGVCSLHVVHGGIQTGMIS